MKTDLHRLQVALRRLESFIQVSRVTGCYDTLYWAACDRKRKVKGRIQYEKQKAKKARIA